MKRLAAYSTPAFNRKIDFLMFFHFNIVLTEKSDFHLKLINCPALFDSFLVMHCSAHPLDLISNLSLNPTMVPNVRSLLCGLGQDRGICTQLVFFHVFIFSFRNTQGSWVQSL